VLEKVVKLYYIAASFIIIANIRKKKISALLNSDTKVIVIIVNLI
jgi:hypothetical protein